MSVQSTQQPIAFRTASGEADFWLVRQFLLDTWALVPPGQVWDVRRWDGSYFHNEQPGWHDAWRGGAAVGLWEADGRVVGVVHPEGPGQAWLNVHPACRFLENEMLAWGEAGLGRVHTDGRLKLAVFCLESDRERRELLIRRGYRQSAAGEVLRRFSGRQPQAPVPLPAGYRLHTVRPGHPGDCERYATLLNASFRRTIHSAQEVATFTTQSPSFDPQLELVAAAPDGSFAALTGMIYDAQNRYGLFEPVCATPEPRPLGLTGALMHEGVRRAMARGAEAVYVGTGLGMAANRFYQAVGFKIIQNGNYWLKEL